LIIAAISTTAILESTVPMLNGNNFFEWKENLFFYLGCLELDLALREDEPPALTDTSTPLEVTKHERWERSNRLSLMFMKSHVTKGIRGSIPECKKATEFMRAVEEQFVSSDKALASTLMKKLSSKTFDRSRSVREHIMEMRDMAAQLKSLEVDISDSFLVHFILNSLPTEYSPFKISYNTHKDKWSVNELLTMCVQEEERLKQEKPQSVHFVATHDKGKSKRGKSAPHLKKDNKLSIKKNDNKDTCFFCKKGGHMKKDCQKYKRWLEKKGNIISLVCHESFFVEAPCNTWWIDSGSTIHIVNTMQGFLNTRKPASNEQRVYSGNKLFSHVEVVGTFRLILKTGYILDLENVFFIPCFSRNLILFLN
jgi:hypothetical protein